MCFQSIIKLSGNVMLWREMLILLCLGVVHNEIVVFL